MSQQLLMFVNDFITGNIAADIFVDQFMENWRIERNNGTVLRDSDNVSECLSTIFCLADLYNGDEMREEYELNAEQLHQRVHDTLVKHKFASYG